MADADPRVRLATTLALDPADPIFVEALSHRSWSTLHHVASNERLELLGDAALGWAVTNLLHASFPNNSEGELAALKGRLVSGEVLQSLAVELGVDQALLLSSGEEGSGGRGKQSVLADAMEACIGAVARVRGIAAVESLVAEWLAPEIDRAQREGLASCLDPKGKLQMISQSLGEGDPLYRFSVSGPDHSPSFHASVRVGETWGWGSGPSKKVASAAAAQRALDRLEAASAGGTESTRGRVVDPGAA